MAYNAPTIESREDFADTPQGDALYWQAELNSAEKALKKWWEQSDRIIRRFLDKRDAREEETYRLNLFTANIQTMRAMLFDKVPQVDVSRRYDDAADDAARVASEMMQRILNSDVECPLEGDDFKTVLMQALDDRLMVGLGAIWVRYVVTTHTEHREAILGPVDVTTGVQATLAEATDIEVMDYEDAPLDYVYWRDFWWSPARTWGEVHWVARRVYLTRDELVGRFGAVGKLVPLSANSQNRAERGRGDKIDAMQEGAWQKAEVFEIWDKRSREVYWVCRGFDRILDERPDPLKLTKFFPCPRPMVANVTTSAFVPRADFVMAQDIYNEIDDLSNRIRVLEYALRVAGVYDKSAEGVQRLLSEAAQNDLIPVDNWAMFAEKGGLKGVMDILPLADIANALEILQGRRSEAIGLLYQVTGMSDIMRGQAAAQGVTATEQAIKAKFASVRVNALEKAFADFASYAQQLRAEIISEHYDDQTIIERSNVLATPDARMAPQALQLIRDEEAASWRINIEPDSLALVDRASMKQERTEFLGAFSQFIPAAQQFTEKNPQAAPLMFEMVKWALASFQGSSAMEGLVDQYIQAIQNTPPQPPQPPPQVQAQQMRMQGQQAQQQARAQADMQKIAASAQADSQKVQQELNADLTRTAAETRAEITKQAAQFQFEESTARRDILRDQFDTTSGKPL